MTTTPSWLNQNQDAGGYDPTLYNAANAREAAALEKLVKTAPDIIIVDDLAQEQLELSQLAETVAVKADWKDGRWVYYPWRRTLVHILSPAKFYQLRTSRNLNLITKTEQEKLKKLKIGIAGLNVGNPAAVCLALEGALQWGKLADNDGLSLSNLNRFRAGLSDLGLNKAILTARQILEINPYAELAVMSDGLKPGTEDDFLLNPRLDILIEEMDHVGLKISLRERARQHGIPVVMVTGNGEDVILDVERYDLDNSTPLLNGHLKAEVMEKIQAGPPAELFERAQLARDFMGAEWLRPRLLESFEQVGKSLVSIPQLAETSFMRGAVVAYTVRQIMYGEIPSGRYHVRLSEIAL